MKNIKKSNIIKITKKPMLNKLNKNYYKNYSIFI